MRQQFIDTYFFDIALMDEWSAIYTDKELFWTAQYFRSYAKEMFDLAKESGTWDIAETAEIFARLLEKSLRIKT